ncbi:MAG: RNA polymerase sigma factor [Terriglobales bacterium]
MQAERATFTGSGKELPDFNLVMRQYGTRLHRVALRQVGNADDAWDAVQEGLLSAYLHRVQFQGRSELVTWLTRIVINAARGQQRKARVRAAASLDEALAAGHEFADHCPSPEWRCMERERHERLQRLLRRLSLPLRQAVVLCELRGLSCAQAAARLGCKKTTVKCRLFRAHQRLAMFVAQPPLLAGTE